jgi:ParB-like chromosome segregation protein Spo0J
MILYRNISEIKPNPNNPRVIKDDKFNKLVKSITEFPEMLEKRPLVCFTDTDGKLVVLGGNMRLKAAKEVGLKELPVMLADDWTEEQKQQFLIKDNVGFGEWNWEVLANEWDSEQLEGWGLDLPELKAIDESEEGDEIKIPKSLQVIPKKEYILIMADEDSEEWQELQSIFKCGLVRQGDCKIGSSSDKVGRGTERVFDLKTFKERVLNELSDSNTK